MRCIIYQNERQQEVNTMKKKQTGTRRLVLLAMLSGILLVMSFTPLGYLNIGPLAISFNMIPVAIGAIALGDVAFTYHPYEMFDTNGMQIVLSGNVTESAVPLAEAAVNTVKA